ncbi:MAG TPA: cysteine--tRNA ligase [Acidimicrobiales bacterium]|nr:cysteine--tRNA ligase [Acidimicrobiales bacterium]
MLHLYDTALGSIEPLTLRKPGELSMYVCGPTVYGDPHIGHGRATLTWDVLRRYATWSGLVVRHVSNVTDVDDKIIRRANEEGTSAEEVARRWEKAWWEAMDRLGNLHPDVRPHATEYIDQMVDLIADLIDRGKAYVADDGVYFASETVEDYGLLTHQSPDALKEGVSRLEEGEERGKRSPIDFVLWKAAKPGEPTWDSPWGPGRPGWHTECVVMSLDLLGDGFDLHGGGYDLIFPHHEDERAQAVAAGNRFSRRWVHHNMIVVGDGTKMSKSLGNYVTLTDLLAAHDPRAYRMLTLQSHYRSPLSVNADNLAAAERAVQGLDAFAREFAGARGGVPDPGVVERFKAFMDDDLKTPQAVAVLFEAQSAARAAGASSERAAGLAAAVFELWEEALGLRLDDSGGEITAEAREKAALRDAARAARDYRRADGLRDELAAEGWIVEDTPAGTKLRRAAR